jgi:SAM-dependent methyltransferase
MNLTVLTCRLCLGSRLSCLGPIPDSDFFAGRVLEQPIPGGKLWLCKECGSMVRHPLLSPEAYRQLYENGADDVWTAKGARNDLRVIREQIAQCISAKTVLDVGCNTGEFLLSLPARVQKFGLEPSTAAGAMAAKSGICIVGRTLEDLPTDAVFDIITIIDVVEHVADPNKLMDYALAHLAPGGSLIVATGDPSNVWWRRLFRSRFWYSAFPEHISFPSARALALWAKSHGLDSPIVQRIRYRPLPLWMSAAFACQMLVYWVSPKLLNVIGRGIERLQHPSPPRRRYFSPGAPGVLIDHQVISYKLRDT